MKGGGSQSNAHNSSESKHLPCDECRALDCHSIHGIDAHWQECSFKQCHICTELAEIDFLIAKTHRNLVKYVDRRRKLLAKAPHDPTLIHRMPVEIVSSIFVFVKDMLIDSKVEQKPEPITPGSPERPLKEQPAQSPPLLVGAVCKRWRYISLQTQCLWTDIIVNLDKIRGGQFAMVKKWARRAGILPLNISIYGGPNYQGGDSEDEESELYHDRYEDILLALRALAPRWRDVALNDLDTFFYRLINKVQEAPGLRTVYLCGLNDDLDELDRPYILRPQNLLSSNCYVKNMPFEWVRLVYLDIEDAHNDDVLHIIQHAPNLQRCVAIGDSIESGDFHMPLDPIVHPSLIYLRTNCQILGDLTLPSLVDLDCSLKTCSYNEEDVEAVAGFLDRSCPSLKTFSLRCFFRDSDSDPDFDRVFARFPAITFLTIDDSWPEEFLKYLTQRSVDTVLPHLKECYFQLDYTEFTALSWELLSHLLMPDTPDVDEAQNASRLRRRQLKKAYVHLRHEDHNISEPPMSKDTFVRLLKVQKKLDLRITLGDDSIWDFARSTANYYSIDL